MKKILAFVLAALLATAGVASAQIVFPGGNLSNPSGAAGSGNVVTPVRIGCTLTTTAATMCRVGAGYIVGAVNDNTVAQTATVSCWGGDTTLTTGAGTLVFATGALGIPGAAGAGFFYLPAPKPFAASLVCTASALPTGGGIDIYVQ